MLQPNLKPSPKNSDPETFNSNISPPVKKEDLLNESFGHSSEVSDTLSARYLKLSSINPFQQAPEMKNSFLSSNKSDLRSN
jgi:hypothetical protein